MDSIVTAMTTQLTSIVTSLQSALASIAPLAIPVIGISLVVTIGISFFMRIARRA